MRKSLRKPDPNPLCKHPEEYLTHENGTDILCTACYVIIGAGEL